MMFRKLAATALMATIALAAMACEEGLPAGGSQVEIDGTVYVAYEVTPTPPGPTPTSTPRPTIAEDAVAQQKRDIFGRGELIPGRMREFEVFADSAAFGVNFQGLSHDKPVRITVKVFAKERVGTQYFEHWTLQREIVRGDDLVQVRLPGPQSYAFSIEGLPDDVEWQVRIS